MGRHPAIFPSILPATIPPFAPHGRVMRASGLAGRRGNTCPGSRQSRPPSRWAAYCSPPDAAAARRTVRAPAPAPSAADGYLSSPPSADERPGRRGQEGGDAERHHPPRQLGQLRHDHEGLHRQVRHQDQRCQPGRLQPGRDQRDQQLKGQSRAPDVLDMGTSFAIKADQQGLLAPYRVATWSDIPAAPRPADGTWYNDYGGYMAIGYNPAKVKVAPTSFKSCSTRSTRTRSPSTATRPRPAPRSPRCTRPRWPTAAR